MGIEHGITVYNPLDIVPDLKPVRITGLASEPPNLELTFRHAGLPWLGKEWGWASPNATLVGGEVPLFGTPILLAHATRGWQMSLSGVFGYYRSVAFDDESGLQSLVGSVLAADVDVELAMASLSMAPGVMRQHRTMWEKRVLQRAAVRALPENALLVSQVKHAADEAWRAQCDSNPALVDVDFHSWWLNLGDYVQWKGMWEPPPTLMNVPMLAFNLDVNPRDGRGVPNWFDITESFAANVARALHRDGLGVVARKVGAVNSEILAVHNPRYLREFGSVFSSDTATWEILKVESGEATRWAPLEN